MLKKRWFSPRSKHNPAIFPRSLLSCANLYTCVALGVALGMTGLFISATATATPNHHCRNYSRLKQPFFGELHSHSTYSQDAATLDTRNTPEDSYRFAKGEKVGLPPFVDTRYDSKDLCKSTPVMRVDDNQICIDASSISEQSIGDMTGLIRTRLNDPRRRLTEREKRLKVIIKYYLNDLLENCAWFSHSQSA